MRLSIKGLAVAAGLLWGGAVLFLGLINLACESYGVEFLKLVSSIYPGFHASRTLGDVLVGTAYAAVDGAVGGVLLAWLYNLVAGGQAKSQPAAGSTESA